MDWFEWVRQFVDMRQKFLLGGDEGNMGSSHGKIS
jgi:hypothetical protein